MRFVAVKPVAAQADAMLFRTRALLVPGGGWRNRLRRDMLHRGVKPGQ